MVYITFIITFDLKLQKYDKEVQLVSDVRLASEEETIFNFRIRPLLYLSFQV